MTGSPAATNPGTGHAGERDCPTCGQGRMQVFYRVAEVPTNSCILLETEAAAREWPKGEIALAACERCGFVANIAFDKALTEYSSRYEETQGFSPTFRKFHEQLAEELVQRHGLRGKRIVEIGCGKGEFLHLLCALGDNRGLGFDPAYVPARDQTLRGEQVEFVADYFSSRYRVEEADFVACKMTLEHILETGPFVHEIRQSVHGRDDTVVFIQVPEATRILGQCAFEDVYYEHCSYFTPASLATLMETHGFRVLRTDITYGDQYLTVEASYGGGPEPDLAARAREVGELQAMVASFPQRVADKMRRWRDDIRARAAAGQRILIWGSGSKGVAFLSSLGLDELIREAVDINPHRRGFFMPGGGQRIVSPEDLPALEPDYIVVMNAVYLDEIRAMLADKGLSPELAAL
ncbi:MAG: methyltransferase domain-containing protein [Gammaproteobacteria bacterium]|nr:MAG: methyltransferase domain-containing protein [Gammaproteobacteria bacterium]